jgi:hypothetical protein
MNKPDGPPRICRCGLEQTWVTNQWRCNPCGNARKRDLKRERKAEPPEVAAARAEKYRTAREINEARSDKVLSRQHGRIMAKARQIREDSLMAWPVRKPKRKKHTIVSLYMSWERRWREPVRGLDRAQA